MNKTNFHSDRYKFAIWKIQFVYSKKKFKSKVKFGCQQWRRFIHEAWNEWQKETSCGFKCIFRLIIGTTAVTILQIFLSLKMFPNTIIWERICTSFFGFELTILDDIFQDSLKIKSNLNFLPKVSTFYMIVSLENWIWKK